MSRSDEELISDDEGGDAPVSSVTSGIRRSGTADFCQIGKDKEFQASMWSAIRKEATGLLHLEENMRSSLIPSASSKRHSCAKGGRGRIKSRTSFHFQAHQKTNFSSSIQQDVGFDSLRAHLFDEVETVDCRRIKQLSPEKTLRSDHAFPAEVLAGHFCSKHSMSELLDGLQGNNAGFRAKSKMSGRTKGRRGQLSMNKSISLLGERAMNDEDPYEDTPSGSSSDDEARGRNLNLAMAESKKKNIADQFEEALGAAAETDQGALIGMPKLANIGLFGKLQRMIQQEKERDLEFLKLRGTEVGLKDEARCLDVKILSTCFEAKLKVCRCVAHKSYNGTQNCPEENLGNTRTIIFSSRVCGDVELEVGNSIRVHAPWKEVEILGGCDMIILATHFSYLSI